MINKQNYEAYLIDLWEGNISPEDREELFVFIANHPELEIYMEDLQEELPKLNQAENLIVDKTTLSYDKVSTHNQDYFFIAYHENELNQEEKNEVERHLKNHPEALKTFEQFKKTKLQAPDLVFKNKHVLIPTYRVNFRALKRMAVAALIALITSTAYFIFMNEDFYTKNNTAHKISSNTYKNIEYYIPVINTSSNEKNKDDKNPTESADNSTSDFTYRQHQQKGKKKLVKQFNTAESKSIRKDEEFTKISPLRYSELGQTLNSDMLYSNIIIPENTSQNNVAISTPNEKNYQTVDELFVDMVKRRLQKVGGENDKQTSYDQSFLALVINKGLNLTTQEEQMVAVHDEGSKITRINLGNFGFERVSSK